MAVQLYASLPRYSKALNPSPPPSPGQTVLPPSCCRDGREAPPCLGSSPSLHPGDCFLLALTFLQQHATTLGTASVAVVALMVNNSRGNIFRVNFIKFYLSMVNSSSKWINSACSLPNFLACWME